MWTKCHRCGRQYMLNIDGSIRRHFCKPFVGDAKRLRLTTGGTLTLRIDANWMLFGAPERELMSVITDAVVRYESLAPPAHPQPQQEQK